MILDKMTTLHNDTEIRAATDYIGTGVHATNNSIDLMAAGNNPGPGAVVLVRAVVTEVFDAGGTSVECKLVMDTVADLATPTTLVTSGAITDPALGYRFPVPSMIPIELVTERYLGIIFTSVGVYTTGKVHAGIVWSDQTHFDGSWPAVNGFGA